MTKRLVPLVLAIAIASAAAFTLGYYVHSVPTTTTMPVTTTTKEKHQPSAAMWPFANTPQRFNDPVTAASSFAVSYLGFTSPVVGPFLQGDSRSGEVNVHSYAGGPVTTILVRQLDQTNSWWVLGAVADNIQITQPVALSEIRSPVTMRGMSTAFEAQVNVEVRADESLLPIGSGFAMGGSMGMMGPFHATVAFSTPSSPYGVLLMRTYSARDGSVLEASAVRVKYAK